MKVVDIPLQKTDPCVIKRVEEALEHTKSNNIGNVIIVMAAEDGSVFDCWATSRLPFQIVGGLESVKIEFMNEPVPQGINPTNCAIKPILKFNLKSIEHQNQMKCIRQSSH